MKKVIAVLDENIKIHYITDERIVFTDESYIYCEHQADCCENNYADFSSIMDSIIDGQELNTIEIEYNDNGFLLNGQLVNCYSEQNGYYSTGLDVYYKDQYDRVILFLETNCGDIDD